MNKKLSGYNPNIAIPPGETITELLESYNMTEAELANKLTLTPKAVNEIINGKAPITNDTASKLEMVFKLPARFWNNLETNYQETKARLDDELGILGAIPYEALSKLGWIPDVRDKYEMALNLRRFFDVSSLELIPSSSDASRNISFLPWRII